MNYFTAILLLLGTSAIAASAHATTNRPNSLQYSCELDSNEQFKEGPLSCKVRGSICERQTGIGTGTGLIPNICNDRKDPIEVECNRGFDLRDRDAATTTKRDDAYVIGTDNGHAAILKIEDIAKDNVLASSEHQQYDAELVLTNQATRRLTGKCWVKLLKPDAADLMVSMAR